MDMIQARLPQVKSMRKGEAQAFRSEVNEPLPARKVAISGAMSRVLSDWGTE